MKINYDQIIELANNRKNALVELQTCLGMLPGMLADARQLHKNIQAINDAWDRLDNEGRKLLPVDVYNQLLSHKATLSRIEDVLQGRDNYSGSSIGLAPLFTAVRKEDE